MITIPKEVKSVILELEKQGFEAYIVGGCVRDLFLEKEPKDWDVATNAKPKEIQKIFPENFYENTFFTVTVQTKSKNAALENIEITTYRAEFEYGDHRRPEKVEYAKTIEEDLSRRDFTINAIVLDLKKKVIDPFEGQKDLKAKQIRAVGNAEERFSEDALRMMRAVRLSSQLGFVIEEKTKKAIQKNSALLKEISQERIRDELVKIIMSENAMEGIELLRELKLLQYILPELEEGYKVSQNKHHIYTVWEHNMLALKYATDQNWDYIVRIASLLHDVAKPRVKRGEGENATFHGHEVVGARMAREILNRLKFSKKEIERISKLIRFHLFYYNVDEVTESSVRRLVRNIGPENVEDLLKVRMADRIGSGVPKAEPYKLRHLRYIIEKATRDPISSRTLKLNGSDIMKMLKLSPGPIVGHILNVLLEEVLDDPKKNNKKDLAIRAKELGEMKETDLQKFAAKAKQAVGNVEAERDEETKKKYYVK
ncbi:CCA tRNA nucleotidyltransferase [Patescibacteria group bacterium]|nr:CCA tRNA nucleotidyltransferase [Patescibacteria group bacterium]